MCVLELLKSILIPFIRPRALFTFLRISFFIYQNTFLLTKRFAWLRFQQKWHDNYSTCKEYTIKDKTKHSEIQAHIFKNSLIIVERFFCVLQLLHWTCANHTLLQIMQRQHGHGPWKTECLCRTDQKGITLSPHWICYHWI